MNIFLYGFELGLSKTTSFTSVLIRSVSDDSVEDSNLTEEHSDQERGAGGVGGRRQQEGNLGFYTGQSW